MPQGAHVGDGCRLNEYQPIHSATNNPLMAAPLFNETEIIRLLSMGKHVRYDDWHTKWSGRAGTQGNARVRAFPAPGEAGDYEFTIERHEEPARDELSLRLYVKAPGREHILCRYDIQVGKHNNPKWYSPAAIGRRAAHRHVYNPEAVRRGTPKDWDICADLVDMPAGGTPQSVLQRLTQVFLSELNVSIQDQSAQQHLFGRQ